MVVACVGGCGFFVGIVGGWCVGGEGWLVGGTFVFVRFSTGALQKGGIISLKTMSTC